MSSEGNDGSGDERRGSEPTGRVSGTDDKIRLTKKRVERNK